MKLSLTASLLLGVCFSSAALADGRWHHDRDYPPHHRHHHYDNRVQYVVVERPVYTAPRVVYQEPVVVYRDRVVYQDRPDYYEPQPRYYRDAPQPRYRRDMSPSTG